VQRGDQTPIAATQFEVSTATEAGASKLVVIANGIPSEPIDITVNP
jgi:hypothetical protein